MGLAPGEGGDVTFLWKLGLPSASDLELGKLVFPEC